jgi:small subunit ribosomal protein S17
MEHADADGTLHGRNVRRQVIGTVSSNKMDKSITVEVPHHIIVPKYEKRMVHSRKYMAHDEKNEAGIGDTVVIMECRKLSKRKAWRLVKILHRKEHL